MAMHTPCMAFSRRPNKRKIPCKSLSFFPSLSSVKWDTGTQRTAKEAAPNQDCLFVKPAFLRCLELLDHPHIPEPPQVVVEAARVANGVPKLVSKRLWRVVTEDVGYTHGERGVVEEIFPAGHGVRNRRRSLLF